MSTRPTSSQPQRRRRPRQARAQGMEQRLERVERKVSNQDAHHLWMKNNNMKQTVVKFTDVYVIQQSQVGGANAFSTSMQLDGNRLSYYGVGGAVVSAIPQNALQNQYYEMYEYWMAKRIEIKWHPVTLDLETTGTGSQDTCTWPTFASADSDTLQTFWAPATSFAGVQAIGSAMFAKKKAHIRGPREVVRMHMDIENTLLLKQDAPMLRTNGAINAREEYSNEAGSLLVVPARNYADRVPFGYCEVSQTILFAGVHKPGIARVLSTDAEQKLEEKEEEIKRLTDQVNKMFSLLSTNASLPSQAITSKD